MPERTIVKTQIFESKSSPGHFHTCTLYSDGVAECDMRVGTECKGYKYSKAVPRECKHTKEMLKEAAGGKISKTALNINRCPVYPMLASPMKEGLTIADFNQGDYFAEVKYNGHRRIVDALTRKAWSRVGNEVDLPPQVDKALAGIALNALLDCELILPGGSATDVKDQSNANRLELVVFDLLERPNSMGGRQSTIEYTQVYRRSLLQNLLPVSQQQQWVRLSEIMAPTEANLNAVWERGEEGLILKKKDGLYEPAKRSRNWVKLKRVESHAMMVVGFEEGELGPYAKLLLQDETGATTSVKTLNDDWREKIAADPQKVMHQILFIEHRGRTSDNSFVSPMADHFLREDLP